jgi:excisionase family DNA binding protein
MTVCAQYLSADQIAIKLGVSVRTVRRWLASGLLRSVRIGGRRLVAEIDLEHLLSPTTKNAGR